MSMFQENPFKIEILSGLPKEATITLYRCTRTQHAVLQLEQDLCFSKLPCMLAAGPGILDTEPELIDG